MTTPNPKTRDGNGNSRLVTERGDVADHQAGVAESFGMFDDPVRELQDEQADKEMAPEPTALRPESVVMGRDKDVIPTLLAVHAMPNPVILDACHNRGVMWKGTGYEPHKKLDIEPLTDDTDRGSYFDMPYDDDTFDVVAFDPPHLPAHAASAGSSGIERHQYGLTEHGDHRQGDNVVPGFTPFLLEAQRVLRPNGIVIAKIADLVHNHRYQWQHVDFVIAARGVGFTPCDVIVKADPCAANLKSSKWKNVRHFRRAHCFWIVLRNGRCERPMTTAERAS